MSKPKIAFVGLSYCGGCDEALLELYEFILDVLDIVEVSFWPTAIDIKYDYLKTLQEKELLVSFVNGAIRVDEQEELARILREKSQYVIAFGACAHMGGIPGLANFSLKEEILEEVYKNSPAVENPEGIIPQSETESGGITLTLPALRPWLSQLNQVIDVDYYIPGCPPQPNLIKDAITALVNGTLPQKGSVLAPCITLCKTCSRAETVAGEHSLGQIKRFHEVHIDPDKCFLTQGILCFGPATRGGCGEKCIKSNMPCRGCSGPVDEVSDQGGKLISSIASVIGSNDEKEIERFIEAIPEPAKLFYMYSLPASCLGRRYK
ncbi:MAG: oxidoreductase [Vulcanimicrobiota bacterium]